MKLCIFIAVLGLALAKKARFDGYQMWDIAINNAEDAKFVMDLAVQDFVVDVAGPLRRSGTAVITVPAKFVRSIGVQFIKRNIAWSVKVDNVQDLIDEEEARMAARRTSGIMAYDPSDFNTLEDNYDHMDAYVASCSSRGLVCSVENAGNSYEGRPINIYKVGTGGSKPIVWYDATVHAREWLATTTLVRMFDYIVEEYGSNAEVTNLMDNYDFWFIPIGNPDGYSYSWTDNRMYRKNRRPMSGGCIGVDLNRNFDFNWCRQGASTSPCSDTYCGPSGGSEPETQAMQDAISSGASRMLTMVTLHTFGEMWMHPWGNTEGFSPFTPCEIPDDFDDLYAAAEAAADGIFETSGQRWAYGTSCEVIYYTTGATDDWAKGAAGVKYTFNPELRSTFVAPASEIDPSFEEVWRGTITMIDKIEEIEGRGYPLNK